jgi:very-short-patch-repair endonuclease
MITRAQLIAVGFSQRSVDRRLARGALHRVFRGVFALGHPALQPLAAETAALLYAGDDCVLSHETAAAIWGLRRIPEVVTMTMIGRHVREQSGLRIHCTLILDSRDVRLRHGFPVTAPARTLIDVAGREPTGVVERALNEARVLKLVTDPELHAAIERAPLRTGVGLLRKLLESERGPALTRSELERRLRTLVQQGQLPWPLFNAPLLGFVVDAVWPAAKLVLEVDGYQAHGHRAAFERDRLRDQRLVAHGYVVVRVTWRQLVEEPMAVLVRLAEALTWARARLQLGERPGGTG